MAWIKAENDVLVNLDKVVCFVPQVMQEIRGVKKTEVNEETCLPEYVEKTIYTKTLKAELENGDSVTICGDISVDKPIYCNEIEALEKMLGNVIDINDVQPNEKINPNLM